MIPISKVRDLISKHEMLEKELSSGQIEKKKYAEKSKEYSDLNDIWIRLKNDNIWGKPINLSQINTNGNDLLLGVDESFIYVLRNNYVFTYSVIEPYELIDLKLFD